ncbi:ABC transporter permease [Clostridium thermobutyricum]|uniref:ABC transporter permease n=1 Tax=Clostridium thermobutyricum TaxID=29372 RepID=UPI0029423ECE|nr:ABC transporter permease [Clostridium thermobutyricum]
MSVILKLIKHNLNLMIFKQKSKLIYKILLPIIAIVIISKLMLGNSGVIKVGVVNNDNTVVSNYLVSQIKDNKNIDVIPMKKSELDSNFASNTIQSAVVIDSGFEKDLSKGNLKGIDIIGKEGDDVYKLVEGIISLDVSNMAKLGKVSHNETQFSNLVKKYMSNNLNVERGALKGGGIDYEASSIFIGFLVMFIFYRAMSGANRVNEDRDQKVFSRIFVSNIKPWQYYSANILSSIFCIAIQVIISVIAVSYFSNINFGMSLITLSFILIIAGLIAVSIGTVFVSITRNTQEASMMTNVVTFALVMVGGCFIPVSIFPKIINDISKFLPTRWIVDIIYNIQTGSSLISQWRYLVLLILFSIALLLISAYFTKRKDKSFLEV